MEIGVISVSEKLLVLMAVALSLWLLISWILVPRTKRDLTAAYGTDVSRTAGRLLFWRSMRSIAFCTVIAPFMIIAVLSFAQWRIEDGARNPEKLQAVIEARTFVEELQEPFSTVALQIWMLSLLVIAFVWIVARMSASRRRWSRALSARRKAEAVLLEDVSTDELLDQARQADEDALAQLYSKADALEKSNRQTIRSMETAKLLSLPQEDGQVAEASLEELHELIATVEDEASTLEADAQA